MQFLYSTKIIYLTIVLLILNGCGVVFSTLSEGESPELNSTTEQKNPILLSLSQGYVAGAVLHLRVQLEFLDAVSSDSIYVQLKGLKNGIVKEEQTLPISKFVEASMLEAGNKIYLPFTLAIYGIDKFTLSCSWGEAGYRLAAQLDLVEVGEPSQKGESKDSEASVMISELKVLEMELPCKSPLCSVRVNLEGRVLRGNKDVEVKSVALAYKLVWVPDGEVPNVAENNSKELEPDEKMLPFGDDVLPIEGFEFKVTGDKDLPKIPGGRFMPVVRILKFEKIGETR